MFSGDLRGHGKSASERPKTSRAWPSPTAHYYIMRSSRTQTRLEHRMESASMNAQQGEKRSTKPKYQHTRIQTVAPAEGVGARQEQCRPVSQGGGYLNNCTASELLPAQFSDLKVMGISHTWLRVARAIGVEPFLDVWRILGQAHDQGAELYSSIRVTVPKYERFLRYQRDAVIRRLANNGCTPAVIHQRLRAEMGIQISLRTVQRVARGRHERENGSHLRPCQHR